MFLREEWVTLEGSPRSNESCRISLEELVIHRLAEMPFQLFCQSSRQTRETSVLREIFHFTMKRGCMVRGSENDEEDTNTCGKYASSQALLGYIFKCHKLKFKTHFSIIQRTLKSGFYVMAILSYLF